MLLLGFLGLCYLTYSQAVPSPAPAHSSLCASDLLQTV